MSDSTNRTRASIVLALALVLILSGLLSVTVYVVAFLAALDQVDQSMAFWMLPFLLFGLSAAGVGLVLVILWLLLRSETVNGGQGPDEQ